MEADATDVAPAAKRQKLTNGNAKPHHPPGASRLFSPYRTVGLVSPTSVPFTAVPLGKTTFQITTSVGRSVQTYDLRRGLNVVFISSPRTPDAINATTAWKDKVIAAWGGQEEQSQRGVWAFKRGKKETELELPRNWRENVQRFCILGSWIVGVCQTQLLVWKSSTLELYTTLQGISPIPLTGCIASLPTFLNKVIVGREDGSAEIWNLSSGKLVYTILPASTTYGAVTAIEPTPALSLVAIAYESGPLVIHDVRTDQTIIQLHIPAGVPVTSISFRTDSLGAGEDGKEAGVMATASTRSGDVTLWDLNKGGRRVGILRAAHAHPTASTPGGVSRVEFLAGQAILVSSGLDNSLKTWIFDEMPFNPIPRILHSRSGHGAPVTNLHFLPSASDGSDDTGKWLMSASKDRSFWGWSLRRDDQSTELSQGAVQKKAKKQGLLAAGNRDSLEELKCPPITSMACSLNRDGGIGAIPGKHAIWQGANGKPVSAEISSMTGWESVVTAHENDNKARTWLWGRKRAGRWAFQTGDGSNVTSVAMSPCGTFAVIGSEKGGIDMYNMQSGIHRRRFPARLTPMQAKQLRLDVEKHGLIEDDNGSKKFYRGQGKHASPVVGLAIDNLNKTVVSAGADGRVKFWDFASELLAHEINWSTSTKIVSMRYHRGSDLAAFSCADGCVRVVDISTHKLIRELWPSRFPIEGLSGLPPSDFTFSNDGNWIAACVGQVVVLWDLPTGHLVDAFKLEATCTAIAFSPNGEFLATATTDSVGVDVWSNRALFTHVSTRHIRVKELTEIVAADSHAQLASGETDLVLAGEDADDAENIVDTLDVDAEANVDQLTSDLLSLSLVPRSRWQNLLHLDLIRQRNKPVEAPKKPEKAPFFLPSLDNSKKNANADPIDVTTGAEIAAERSRIGRLNQRGVQTEFTGLLHASTGLDYFSPFLEHLQTLNPAAADVAIRSMGQNDGEMVTFVQALTWLMHQRRDFELGQAWMAVFLRIHGDVVLSDERLRQAVDEWSVALQEEKRRVQRLASYCNGVVGYLRAARV